MKSLKKLTLLLALLALVAGVVGWENLVDNFLGKALTPSTFKAPSNNTVPVYLTSTGKWTAQAITAGMLPAHATTHQSGGTDQIAVTGLSGLLADPQLVESADEGTLVGTRKRLNFIGAGVTAADNAGAGRVDVTIPGGSTIAVQDGTSVVGTSVSTLIFEAAQFIGIAGPVGYASIALQTSGVTSDSIAPAAVTYAKIQNVTDARLLGRSSGSAGPPIEITASGGVTLASGALTWDGFTLFDGATSIDAALKTMILSGAQFDTSGSAGTRQVFLATGGVTTDSLGAASVTYAKIQNVTDARLLGRSAGSSGSPQEITASGGVTLSGGALTWDGAALLDGATSVDTALKTIILNGVQFGTSGSAGVRQIFIDTNGVTADAIAADAVGSSEIAADSVDTSEIVGGAPGAAGAELADSATNLTAATSFTFTPKGRSFILPAAKTYTLGANAGDPASMASQEFYFDSNRNLPAFKTPHFTTAADESLSFFAATSDSSAVVNTVTETAFSTTTSVTLSANSLKAGNSIRYIAWGKYSDTGTPTLTFKIKLRDSSGNLTDIGGSGGSAVTNATNVAFSFHGLVTVRTTGASGSSEGIAYISLGNSSSTLDFRTAATIDTTKDSALVVTATWGTADPANTTTLTGCHYRIE